MKRARKWSADSRAGERRVDESERPLRRRKALRHLDSLALDPEREPSPGAAVAHVRVIGEPDGVSGVPRVVPRPPAGALSEVEGAPGSGGKDTEGRPHGDRVQAVPIDQPFPDPPGSGTPEC